MLTQDLPSVWQAPPFLPVGGFNHLWYVPLIQSPLSVLGALSLQAVMIGRCCVVCALLQSAYKLQEACLASCDDPSHVRRVLGVMSVLLQVMASSSVHLFRHGSDEDSWHGLAHAQLAEHTGHSDLLSPHSRGISSL